MSEAARPQPYEVWETRDGGRAISMDLREDGRTYPLSGLIWHGRWVITLWTADGRSDRIRETGDDLVRLVHAFPEAMTKEIRGSFAHLMTPEAGHV